ncbi:MAG: hypothetical protein ABSF09_00520 [Candidatus Bathyarchaeia archaeon]
MTVRFSVVLTVKHVGISKKENYNTTARSYRRSLGGYAGHFLFSVCTRSLMANIQEIISTLERAAEDAVKRYNATGHGPSQDPMAQQRMAQAGVLSAYATYKFQEGTLTALKEQTLDNI